MPHQCIRTHEHKLTHASPRAYIPDKWNDERCKAYDAEGGQGGVPRDEGAAETVRLSLAHPRPAGKHQHQVHRAQVEGVVPALRHKLHGALQVETRLEHP